MHKKVQKVSKIHNTRNVGGYPVQIGDEVKKKKPNLANEQSGPTNDCFYTQ